MSTITTTISSASHASQWDQLQAELQRLDQAVSRPELEGFRRIAYDIGISDDHRKLNKPFWIV